jgi:hypothetical protein
MLDRFRQRNPLLATILFVALVLSAILTVSQGAINGSHWIERRFFWRDAAYKTLHELSAGVDVRNFDDKLGTPLLRQHSAAGNFEESIYRVSTAVHF